MKMRSRPTLFVKGGMGALSRALIKMLPEAAQRFGQTRKFRVLVSEMAKRSRGAYDWRRDYRPRSDFECGSSHNPSEARRF